MKLLNGSDLAGFVKERQVQETRDLLRRGITPRLTIISTDSDPVSQIYLKLKQKYGADIGAKVDVYQVPMGGVFDLINELNQDNEVHGIIVQLPLADLSQTDKVLNSVSPVKDVDGLGEHAVYDPATPVAIVWLLAGYNVDLASKTVAVVGQGRLVGAPLTQMLTKSGVEVTVFDENSKNLAQHLPEMDVIISATGQPGLLKSELVKSGAVVVDAGTAASEGGVVKGDASDELYDRKDLTLTPKKGGVGPLTVAALFDNLLRAARGIVASP